jgi:predicted dehydrogenase
MAIIVTPTYTHHVLAIDALELGLNVISEKNMAVTIDQGRQMVKTAAKYPHLCTAVGTQTRFFPWNWSLKKAYLNNKERFGKITSLNMTYLYNWGKSRQGWRRWLVDLFLDDMAPHHFDLIRYISGLDVVQVQGAVNFKPSFSKFRGSSTTFAILALALPLDYNNPDNWIYMTYRGDWQKKGDLYHRIEVNCEGGELNLVDRKKYQSLIATYFTDEEGFNFTREKVAITSDVENNPHSYDSEVYMLEEMSVAIDSKGHLQPQNNYRDAIKSFAISRGIVESFNAGKAVFLPKYWENLP